MNDPRRLKVLDAAYLLVGDVHDAIRLLDERQTPGLKAQALRAVDAIAANIAEGARDTRPQFASFLRIALRSADEVGAHLKIAYHAKALPQQQFFHCEARRTVVCRMLHRLIKSLDESTAREHNERVHQQRSTQSQSLETPTLP